MWVAPKNVDSQLSICCDLVLNIRVGLEKCIPSRLNRLSGFSQENGLGLGLNMGTRDLRASLKHPCSTSQREQPLLGNQGSAFIQKGCHQSLEWPGF